MLIVLINVKLQVSIIVIVVSALFDMTSHAGLHMTDQRVGMFV